MGVIRLSTKLDKIGIDIKGLEQNLKDSLIGATAQLSRLAYNRAVELSASRLHSTRDQYVSALKLAQEGDNVFVVYLLPEAQHLESGYPGFDMLPGLTHGPKSKVSKEGHRYVVVPFRHGLGDKVGDSAPKDMSGESGDMLKAIKQVVEERKWKIAKAEIARKSGKFTTVERYTGAVPHPNLKGLTRVREYAGNKKEGKPLSSAYFTFRVASEKQAGKGKWQHPGFKGAQIFPELEKWTEQQLDQILKEFFGS